MNYDKQLNLATAASRQTVQWSNTVTTISEFYARLAVPVRGAETLASYLAMKKADQDRLKDVGGYVVGVLRGGQRRNGCVESRCAITLDVDSIRGSAQPVIDAVNALGCGYCIYSTRKHTPEAPRLRIILPLDDTLAEDEYEPAARIVMHQIDPTMNVFDRTTAQAPRMMYFPSCCKDSEYVYLTNDAPLLNGHAILASLPDWHDVSKWYYCPDEAVQERKTADRQQDPRAKGGIVGAFCRTYNVPDAIDTFLPGIYTSCDTCDDRYTYAAGSTSGGAILYGDGDFLYSHHATDPAGGMLLNAFDLVRVHLFGEQDGYSQMGTPVAKLPSYKAMCDLAKDDCKVRKQLVSDRADKIRSDFADAIQKHQDEQKGAELDDSAAEPSKTSLDTVSANLPQVAETPSQSVCGAVVSGGEIMVKQSATVKADKLADDISTRLAELLIDDGNNVTIPLVETALQVMGVRVGRNEITGKVEISGMPAEYSQQNAADTLPVLVHDFFVKNKVKAGVDIIRQCISALSDKNRFNPVKLWLQSLTWDGCDRWQMIYEILGIDASHDDPNDDNYAHRTLYRTMVRKWFLQCVALGVAGGEEIGGAEGALVLQGPQGCGKTLFFKAITPKYKWFGEGLRIDMADKDTIIRATSVWIAELGELDSTMKKDQSSLKAFITSASDTIRAPYGATYITGTRHASFCGTVNPEDYLRDDTGDRRFFTVPVKSIDCDTLLHISADIVAQVWAQAYCEWVWDKRCYRLTAAEHDELNESNEAFREKIAGQEEVEDYLDFNLPEDQYRYVYAANLADLVKRGTNAKVVGRALTRISRELKHIKKRRTMKGMLWLVPLKLCYSVEQNEPDVSVMRRNRLGA